MGRHLLTQLCDHFKSDLAAQKISLPAADATDEEYCKWLAGLLKSPSLLPARFKDTLFEIEEFATPDHSQFLKHAAAHASRGAIIAEGICHERVALQVWLAMPSLLLSERPEQPHLISFEGFVGRLSPSGAPPVPPPGQTTLAELSDKLNACCRQRNPDAPATRIEVYSNEPDHYWFLVRHGDTCRWVYNLHQQKAELVHFPPHEEEAVLYLAAQDELWITARTAVERELYRQQFGLYLQGHADHFSHPWTVSLEPLRVEGPEALDPTGVPQITKAILRHVRVDRDGGGHELCANTADDIFKEARRVGHVNSFLPKNGRLSHATMSIQLTGTKRSRLAEICPPSTLSLERPSDLPALVHLLQQRGFRIPKPRASHPLSHAA